MLTRRIALAPRFWRTTRRRGSLLTIVACRLPYIRSPTFQTERVPSRDSCTCYRTIWVIRSYPPASSGQQTLTLYALRKVRKVSNIAALVVMRCPRKLLTNSAD